MSKIFRFAADLTDPPSLCQHPYAVIGRLPPFDVETSTKAPADRHLTFAGRGIETAGIAEEVRTWTKTVWR